MHNIEYKAECRDLGLARSICSNLGAFYVADIHQTDTYFRVADGRLKKRETEGMGVEYIAYTRSDDPRPRQSDFTIYTENQALDRFGRIDLPVLVVVRKRRTVMTHHGVRIHLDNVDSLGSFVEFEAMVCPDRPGEVCYQSVGHLRESLAMVLGEPLGCSYADLALAELADAG